MTDLFTPLSLGDLTLPNRVIMAPLTRMRSLQPGNIPGELNAAYYAQRAGAGLIISEATQICPEGQGYPATPGIHTPEQAEGWKLVTRAVKKAGGHIFLQLWHVGRISHSSFQPGNALPVAPSAIACKQGKTFTKDWKTADFETPRALSEAEVSALPEAYKKAAQLALEAGFDGVEIHGANGYLIDQFLQDGTNTREDRYGGSIANRARLLMEICEAVAEVWPKSRIGVRLSPYGTFNDMHDSDPVALFTYVLQQLSAHGIGYAHVIEPRSSEAGGGESTLTLPDTAALFRPHFQGVFISAGGYTPEEAKRNVAEGKTDAVAFGRRYISNPDLAERIRQGAPLAAYDRATFYGGGEKGYTDYPTLDNAAA